MNNVFFIKTVLVGWSARSLYIPPSNALSNGCVLCIVLMNGSELHPLNHHTKTRHATEGVNLPVRAAKASGEPVLCLILRYFL